MKNIKKILELIIILIMVFLIVITILLNVVKITILKEKYVLQKLEESNYYETMYQEIHSVCNNYIMQSGLDEITLKDIYTKEQVKTDTQLIIQNIYRGTKNEINTEEIRIKLNESIQNQLKDVTVTEHTTQAINELINMVCKEYENKIMQTQYNQKINTFIEKGSTSVEKSVQIILTFILLLMAILIVISIKKQKIKTILWIGKCMLISGVFLELISICINSKIVMENINVLTLSISRVIQIIINDILSKMITWGMVIVILGIMAIVIGNIIKNKKYNYKKVSKNYI